LKQGDHDAIELADVERVATSLAESVDLVNQHDARSRFREAEEVAEMKGSLPKVRTDDGIESHDVDGQT
jgi:hypothetical protein